MTENQPDVVWTFIRALPDKVRHDLNRTEKLVAGIHRAINQHGWTADQLARHCAKNLAGHSPGGIIQHRLDAIDGPPSSDGESPFGPRRPFCTPECRDNGGWILDAAGMPAKRCTCRTTTQEAHA